MKSSNIVYEDNGNWASGFCEEYKSMLHICDSASSLSLVYNLCTEEDDDDEISHLCYVSEHSLNYSTSAERNHEIFYGLVGRVITEKQIESINKRFEPFVKEFIEVRKKIISGDGVLLDKDLEYKYNILRMDFEKISESETFCVSEINIPNNSPYYYYHDDPQFLDLIFSEAEEPIIDFIRETALEETFTHGVLYHPDEIEATLSECYEWFSTDD